MEAEKVYEYTNAIGEVYTVEKPIGGDANQLGLRCTKNRVAMSYMLVWHGTFEVSGKEYKYLNLFTKEGDFFGDFFFD